MATLLVLSNGSVHGGDVESVLAAIAGDDKRAIQAVRELENERAALVAGLCKIIEKARHDDDFPKFKHAVLALGKLRAVEAMDVLIDNIGYADPVLRQAEEIGDKFILPFDLYPAEKAVFDIGPCAVNHLLGAIVAGRLKTDDQLRVVGSLIVQWLGAEIGEARVAAFRSTVKSEEAKARLASESLIGFFKAR